jgi:hypothetical protein
MISQKPIIIPSHQIQRYDANNAPTSSGIGAQWNIPLFNCSSIMIAYPQTSHQCTVLRNPQQVNVRLKVGDRFVPFEAYDTTGIIHLTDQKTICALNGALNCTPDFENSIIAEHC